MFYFPDRHMLGQAPGCDGLRPHPRGTEPRMPALGKEDILPGHKEGRLGEQPVDR